MSSSRRGRMQATLESQSQQSDMNRGRTALKKKRRKVQLKQSLLSNYYSVLSKAPPTCQVEVQDKDHINMVNEINKLKEGVLNGSIPSTFADSAATSNIGTTKDQSKVRLSRQGKGQPKCFACQMGRWRKQQQWTNSSTNYDHQQETYTSCHQLNVTCYSAYPSLSTQITLRSLTRMK